MAKIYSLGNSLSPMMFRRKHKKDQEEKEQLSRSLDNLLSIEDDRVGVLSKESWPEVASLKRAAPVVMCLLPPFSTDLVCSALLSAGAMPLVTDGEGAHSMTRSVACLPVCVASCIGWLLECCSY